MDDLLDFLGDNGSHLAASRELRLAAAFSLSAAAPATAGGDAER